MNQKELYRHIKENQPNICQIIILQNDREIYSAQWNGYQRNDCTHIMSATKSIMALLTGIAVDKGMIGSVDDKVLSFFPGYPVKRGEKTIHDVTIRHLLTMRAPYKGKGDPWTKVCSSDDWTTASLASSAEETALPMSLITGQSASIFFPAFSIRLQA